MIIEIKETVDTCEKQAIIKMLLTNLELDGTINNIELSKIRNIQGQAEPDAKEDIDSVGKIDGLDRSSLTIQIKETVDLEIKLAVIKEILANLNLDGSVNGVGFSECRMSFFEWQNGNLFYGPNTAIRAEPGKKEDIDYDGKYFVGAGISFEALITAGNELKEGMKSLNGTKNEKKTQANELQGGDGTEEIETAKQRPETPEQKLERNLKIIIDITRNKSNMPFHAEDWQVIDDPEDLDTVSKIRPHIEGYAFFVISENNLTNILYQELSLPSKVDAFFKFRDKNVGFITAGNEKLIKIEDSKSTIPTKQTDKQYSSILDELVGLKYITKVNGNVYQVASEKVKTSKKTSEKVETSEVIIVILNSIKDYGELSFQCSGKPTETDDKKSITFEVNEEYLTCKKKITTRDESSSLYNYLSKKNVPIRTYLPKVLCGEIGLVKNKQQNEIEHKAETGPQEKPDPVDI